MKLKPIVLAVLSIVFLNIGCVNSEDNAAEYSHENDGTYDEYIKTESNGCMAVIRTRNDSTHIDFWYGEGCSKQSPIVDTRIVATHFDQIANHFKIANDFKNKEVLSINIGSAISHEPLIHYINNNTEWPNNYIEYFDANNTNEEDSYSAYVKSLRDVILTSKLYDPFKSVMNEMGCPLVLKERYVDGIFYNKHILTQKKLVEWEVLTTENAKKELYPSLKGGMEFDIKCQ